MYFCLGQLWYVTESPVGVAAFIGYVFDAQGSVKQTTSSVGSIHDEYDPMTGQLTRKWTGADISHIVTDLTYAYDAFGRLATVTLAKHTDVSVAVPVPEVTAYAYDAAGNLQITRNANNMLSVYAYDALNRLAVLSQVLDITHDGNATPRNGTPDADEVNLARFVYTLNADGSRATETDLFNTTTPITTTVTPTIKYTWAYDTESRLVDEKYETSTSATNAALVTAYRDTYSFDLVGNRLTLVHLGRTSATNQTTYYAYDEDDRVLTETYTMFVPDWEVSAKFLTTYTYKDAAASWTMPTRKRQELYDPTTGEDWGMNTQTTYTYTLRGKLASSNTTNLGGFTYGYDAAGNRVSQGANTYLVDTANPTGYSQVLEVYSGGTLKQIFGLGLDVISQSGAGGTLTADANGDGRVDVTDLGILATNYGSGSGNKPQVTGGAADGDFNGDGNVDVTDLGMLATEYGRSVQVLTFLYDAHGSTRAVVLPNGAVAQSYAYTAYGTLVASVSVGAGSAAAIALSSDLATAFTSLLYSGEWTDPTGLQYLRARYYDPNAGRFIGFDSYRGNNADPASLHKYLYTHGDPINSWDPTGNYGIIGGLAIVAGVMGLAALVSGGVAATTRQFATYADPNHSTNWGQAWGEVHHGRHSIQLTFPVGSGSAAVLADGAYGHLASFDLFVTPYASARLTSDNIIYFDSLGVAGYLSDIINPNEVAVRRILSPDVHEVTGVTLGAHMLVGVRRWRVEVISTSPVVLEISTEAYEQANFMLNYYGAKNGPGYTVQKELWSTYMRHIGDFYRDNFGASSTGVSAITSIVPGINPWRATLPPELQ